MKELLIFLTAIFLSAGIASAQQKRDIEEGDPVQQVKTKGIQFVLPEDWPIEKRNGAVGPIPIEEYMSIRFKKVDDRIAALEKRMLAQEQGSLVKVNTAAAPSGPLRSLSDDEQNKKNQTNQAYEEVEENVTAIN